MFTDEATETLVVPPADEPGPGVLLVGWKLPAVRALRMFGVEVTCVLRHAEKRALPAMDGVTLIPVADPADVEGVLAALSWSRPFVAVVSAQEWGQVTAAVLGGVLGTRAMSLDVAMAMRDKFVQKSRIRSAGLDVARCRVLPFVADIVGEVGQIGGFPVVVKPLNGLGARDTLRLSSAAEAVEWAVSAEGGPWLVEEFVAGSELHLDGVVQSGHVTTLTVSRYLENLMEVHGGALVGSVCLSPMADGNLYEQGGLLAERALAALGHRDGVFHLEAFEQPDGRLVFSECAGRVSGGRVDDVTRLATGVDLHLSWAAAALAEEIAAPRGRADAARAKQERVFGCANLTAPAGVIAQMPRSEDVLARPGVIQCSLRHQVGDRLGRRTQSFDRVGEVVVAGADWAEVDRNLRQCALWFASSVRSH